MIDPILSCKEAIEFEKDFFSNSKSSELDIMISAGRGIFHSLVNEINIPSRKLKILALIGGGHNGGDAIALLSEFSNNFNVEVDLMLAKDKEDIRENTSLLLSKFLKNCKSANILDKPRVDQTYDFIIDGLLGMNACGTPRGKVLDLIILGNKLNSKYKISIDIPSGLNDENPNFIFEADYTYATGIAKDCLFNANSRKFIGRIRYIDLGFFNQSKRFNNHQNIIKNDCLNVLKKLRKSFTDKRDYGHLFIFGGSLNFAGALLLNVKAALHSGVGLVTAFVPESLHSSFVSAEPSAMWIPCPEDSEGCLSLESFALFKKYSSKATAILAGSGLGKSRESNALIYEVIRNSGQLPIVLDADAIMPNLVNELKNRKNLITPHCGEFLRLENSCDDLSLMNFCSQKDITTILKSNFSKICNGKNIAICTRGSPILARGGSGDILAGICGALLAQNNISPFDTACIATTLLGLSAELAFKKCGETAFATSELPKYFSKVLND